MFKFVGISRGAVEMILKVRLCGVRTARPLAQFDSQSLIALFGGFRP